MKVDSKQPRSSKKKIQITSKNSGPESSSQSEASTLRTASMRILSVLDPRVQKAAESAVVASRNTIKKRLTFQMPRGKLKISRTTVITPEEEEAFTKDFNQLMGEVKRDDTLKRKADDQP